MYTDEQRNHTSDVRAFKRCAFYGRYSTQMQRPASLEDQLRACQEYAASVGWVLLDEHCYTDAGKSGTSKNGRDSMMALEAALEVRPRLFDYILFDDTSRLSRDVADTLNFKKLTDYHGVGLRFVSQQFDTINPNFDISLQLYSMIDSQQVARQSKKTFAGQKGRVLAGFHAGSVPYGYKIVRVANPDDPTGHGQAASLGSKLVQVPEQVVVVHRIFQLFVDGHSVLGIAKIFNSENIPSPQNARAGRQKSDWGPDPIKDVLHNEKYIGWNVWNVTSTNVHPTTGKMLKVRKPASEHIRMFLPELRVVSDELWKKAVERLAVMEDAQARRVQGGYNRAKDKPYLFSGFLACGGCGSKLVIGGPLGKSRYRCPNNRVSKGCPCSISIPERQLAKELTAALAKEVFNPEYLESLISDVADELQALWRRQQETLKGEELPDIERQIKDHRAKIDHLLDQLEDCPSAALQGRLSLREFEVSRLETCREILKGKRKLAVSRDTLAELVHKNVNNLLAVLEADVPLARQVLAKHVKMLTVFSDPANSNKDVVLIGELDLFSGENIAKYGVLLGDLGTQNPQQHTENLTDDGGRKECDNLYRFMMPLVEAFAEPCHYHDPLARLLRKHPELSLEPHYPGDWGRWVLEELGNDWPSGKALGYGAMARCFRVHRDLLSETFIIKKVKDPSTPGHLYQISLAETIEETRLSAGTLCLVSAA